ncbi:hypothetical protein VKT23_020542 [Stygiomarasmius scandens]|uniref:Uncharacterized protein n=1 Tax=Marasmiellus scandens TaxID=2682957 RepID=A0ABR1IIV9_9AGAR
MTKAVPVNNQMVSIIPAAGKVITRPQSIVAARLIIPTPLVPTPASSQCHDAVQSSIATTDKSMPLAPLRRHGAVECIGEAPSDDTFDIPEWIEAKWEEAVLPSLYHLLWLSEAPFTDFTKGPRLVGHVQRVLDAVYPGHTFVVELGSDVLKKAYANLNEKRSSIGALTLKLVKTHFAKMKPNDPASVESYSNWALSQGPALFRVPVSRGHSHQDDPLYTPPEDIFESTFIIQAMTVVLKPIQKSVLKDPGYPKGALALVATGVERAFISFSTGVFIPPGDFSHYKIFNILDGYFDNVKQLSDRRWQSILSRCQVEQVFRDVCHKPLRAAAAVNMHRRTLCT